MTSGGEIDKGDSLCLHTSDIIGLKDLDFMFLLFCQFVYSCCNIINVA